MECCSGVSASTAPKHSTSRAEFLTLKLSNFKAYLEPFCTTESLRAKLEQYASLEAAMPFMLQAVALRAAGAPLPVEPFVAEFSILEQKERQAFATKVERYFNMFCDVLTS